jgi:hypothetical protein
LAKDVIFVMKKKTAQILPKSMNYLKHIDHQSTCLLALTCKKDGVRVRMEKNNIDFTIIICTESA